MEQKMLILAILVIISQFSAYNHVNAAGPMIFDIKKYGAKPGGDISEALNKAWKEACNSTEPSKILIGPGKWTLCQVRLEGPNKAPMELEVQGTVEAYEDVSKLPKPAGEWIMINYVNNFTLYGGGVFDGMGKQAWKMNDCHKKLDSKKCKKLPINLSFNYINNSYIHDITSKDSKNFHSNCISSFNVTYERIRISAPEDSPNTDGIHIARGINISVINTIIETGDDCISMGDELMEVHIRNVSCGPGHGISIGSLGKNPNEKDVCGIYVTNCTFINTMNGVRVKTWPSAPATLRVSNIRFENLVMDNVSNPVIIDQNYCPWNLCSLDKPSQIKVSNVTIKNIRGTTSSMEALTFACSKSHPCAGVEVGDIDLKYTGTMGKITTKCNNIQPKLFGYQSLAVCSANKAG